jgi:hypothetical protein
MNKKATIDVLLISNNGNGVFYWVRPEAISRGYQALFYKPSVAAGSNTSTVTLRVVGGDEKGSFKCETVKYGRKSQGIGPEKHCAGKGQQNI